MPSPEFFAGLLALALTFAAALFVATLTGLDPTWTLTAMAGLILATVAFVLRRNMRQSSPPADPLDVDWSDRLTDTDFALSDTTSNALDARGTPAQSVLGTTLVFATRDDTGTEIWFEGTLVPEDDEILIRATEPV